MIYDKFKNNISSHLRSMQQIEASLHVVSAIFVKGFILYLFAMFFVLVVLEWSMYDDA